MPNILVLLKRRLIELDLSTLELQVIKIALLGVPLHISLGGMKYSETREIIHNIIKKINQEISTEEGA